MGAKIGRAVLGCLIVCLNAGTHAGQGKHEIILPSPQLIHCRSAQCSQLWKQDSSSGLAAIYPSQVLTDIVDGEVVGLTAVYDKSVSQKDLEGSIDEVWAKWALPNIRVWRVEPEQIAVAIADGEDGAKELIYLKFGTSGSHVPKAHFK